MSADISRELAAVKEHLDLLSQLVTAAPGSPLLVQFCERLDALIDEFGWELGVQ